MEEEDDDGEDESDSDYEGCEESGLGLLARFAASALPVSSTPMTLHHEGKQRSRQSALGNTGILKVLEVLRRNIFDLRLIILPFVTIRVQVMIRVWIIYLFQTDSQGD